LILLGVEVAPKPILVVTLATCAGTGTDTGIELELLTFTAKLVRLRMDNCDGWMKQV